MKNQIKSVFKSWWEQKTISKVINIIRFVVVGGGGVQKGVAYPVQFSNACGYIICKVYREISLNIIDYSPNLATISYLYRHLINSPQETMLYMSLIFHLYAIYAKLNERAVNLPQQNLKVLSFKMHASDKKKSYRNMNISIILYEVYLILMTL